MWPRQISFGPYSGLIRLEFGRIRGGIRGVLGRFGVIHIVWGGTIESSSQIDSNNANRAESAQNATNSSQNPSESPSEYGAEHRRISQIADE